MKKRIRWRGLLVFLALAVILFAAFYFFIEYFLEKEIEKRATLAVGAKVELDDLDLGILPLGVTLTGLRVTNPDKPMTNAVDIKEVGCNLDGHMLFWSKVIIDEMTVDGIRLNTPRKTSGAITSAEVTAKKTKREEPIFPQLKKIPTVKEILEKEELNSLKLIEAVRDDINNKQDQWQKIITQFSDKKKLNEYKQKLGKMLSLPKGDLMGIFDRAKEVEEIRSEISSDVMKIKSARTSLDKDLKLLRKRVKEAEAAPQQDIDRLRKKYTLSAQGVANISRLLFGEAIADRTKTALRWYGKIKPFLEKEKETKEEKPTQEKAVSHSGKKNIPDFLIRTAQISSLETPIGTLSGKIQNITPDQNILGLPLLFKFSGGEINNIRSVEIDGGLDHIIPSRTKDVLNYRLDGYQLRNVTLSDKAQKAISLEKGTLNLDLQAKLTGDNLIADLKADLSSSKVSLKEYDKSNTIAKLMDSALSDISQFTLNARISGTIDDYHVRLTSDLDRILSKAVGQQAEKMAAQLEKELQATIVEKTRGPMDNLRKSLGGLEAIDRDLADRLKLASGLL